MMVSAFVSRIVILVFGTLYPAYASYKAVKTKNVKEYVKWMMYWIVFAFFTCAETFADVLVAFWLPFYYELKILFLVWLLSPATKGSSILYRKFVHPQLNKHEQGIDEYLAKAKDQGYTAVVQLGSRGLNYATSVMMQTALKGQATLVNQLKKSYSTSDLSGPTPRLSLQFAEPLMEVDSATEDLGLEDNLDARHRWQSEGDLLMEGTVTDEEVLSVRTKEVPMKTRSGRSRSVKASRSSSDAGKTTPQHDDVAAYVTLPRAKTKPTKRKHNLKTM